MCLFVNSNIHLEEQRVLTLELHQIILVHLAVSLVGMFQHESAVIGRVPREPGGCHIASEGKVCCIHAETVGLKGKLTAPRGYLYVATLHFHAVLLGLVALHTV